MPDVNFTTHVLVKARLNIDASVTADDTQIQLIIDGIVAKFKTFTGSGLYTGSYTEVHDGKNNGSITVVNPPITAVSSLKVDEIAIVAATLSTDFGYKYADNRVYIQNATRPFTRGVRNVTLVYTGGYTTIPQDLKEAALQQACFEYKRRRHEGETSKSLGDGQVLNFESADLLPAVKEVLKRYERAGYVI